MLGGRSPEAAWPAGLRGVAVPSPGMGGAHGV